ncbi:MAG: amino acid permease [Candidatus Margulisiibacteriota bacterium]
MENHAKKLKKALSSIDVFSIATGAMISSGLFILPGLAYAKAGSAVIISYLLASLLCIPALFSTAELTTAMPRAGGDYFYIMRGFGALLGTIAGFCSWLSLSLKTAFALIGLGAYISIVTHYSLVDIALVSCAFFVILNLVGVKEAGRFQVMIVAGLLLILSIYVIWGLKHINLSHFTPFMSKGSGAVFATASFVFISFGGLTKVSAVAEEIQDPGKNLPLGMLLAFGITTILYLLVVAITVGVVKPEVLGASLTPVSDGAAIFGGSILQTIISIGALFAFISTANAGIMAASRYPLAMSRDKLLPTIFQRISTRLKTPYVSILFTGTYIAVFIVLLKLELLVKVASSILILLFIMANATVIIFRESKISDYRPVFLSPFYPALQIAGILGGIFLLIEMGSLIIFLMLIFLAAGYSWYKFYVEKKTHRGSAFIHLMARFVSKDKKYHADNLLTELKKIVSERHDSALSDSFSMMIEESTILDIKDPLKMEELFIKISEELSKETHLKPGKIFDRLLTNERENSSLIRESLAVPSIIVDGTNIFKLVTIRARGGVVYPNGNNAYIIFVLVSSEDQNDLRLETYASIVRHLPKVLDIIKNRFEM